MQKKQYLPIPTKVVEPKLFIMVFTFPSDAKNLRYHRQEIAYDLESAVKKLTLNVNKEWITPSVKNLEFHSTLSMSEIKSQLKSLR